MPLGAVPGPSGARAPLYIGEARGATGPEGCRGLARIGSWPWLCLALGLRPASPGAAPAPAACFFHQGQRSGAATALATARKRGCSLSVPAPRGRAWSCLARSDNGSTNNGLGTRSNPSVPTVANRWDRQGDAWGGYEATPPDVGTAPRPSPCASWGGYCTRDRRLVVDGRGNGRGTRPSHEPRLAGRLRGTAWSTGKPGVTIPVRLWPDTGTAQSSKAIGALRSAGWAPMASAAVANPRAIYPWVTHGDVPAAAWVPWGG